MEEDETMADITALQADCVAAEAAKDELVAERVSKRAKLSKYAFREYNAETHSRQVAVQAAVTAANKAFKAGLDGVRADAVAQVIDVGTLEEGNRVGAVSS